ncbi:diguanylate cyclase (GGDEF domain) with PAS/PAC sensor [hydrothermal vent metagenome]|uniref:Diguanylate cyclase (GGDEF domain) with PAS/PAC sensor n=1 Tax=hydrothermal vent metagenome TaxID=652676 RepID=A0A3B0YIW9_9ZZZZ
MNEQLVNNIHWQLDMLQSIDVGLVVIDRDYTVKLWNAFMANHSGISSTHVVGENLFDLFPDIPKNWLKRKAESVFLLKNRCFNHWEQRPFLFRFKTYRPITGAAEFMYQNVTLIPVSSPDGTINQLSMVIYDVTDIAVGKQQLHDANERLALLSRTDSLTQLNNRGYWEDTALQEFRRLQRTGADASLVMFDIDHFKRVNDGYGHPAGDEAIRSTARVLQKTIRTTDIAGRYGGEEFGIVLVETDTEGAMVLAERLRSAIEAMTVVHEDHEIRFTISIGIAQWDSDLVSHEQWIDYADQALYEAKKSGRNRVIFFSKNKQAQ